jgi:hypothetical protein
LREDQTDPPGLTVLVKLTGGNAGPFMYSALRAPVALQAITTCCLVSSETAHGERWYDCDRTVTATGGLSVSSAVWSHPGDPYTRDEAGGLGHGPMVTKGVSGIGALR